MSNNKQNNNPWVTVPNTSQVFIPPGPWFNFNYNPTGYSSPEDSKEDEEKDKKDGCTCKVCKQFSPYSEPNQSDKKTFICYACRHGY